MTPIWDKGAQKIKVDITINGYDYSGNIDFEFTPDLLLHRVFPMAGPFSKSINDSKILGQGFRPVDQDSTYDLKWGLLGTDSIQRSGVYDYKYQQQNWFDIEKGNEELKSYWYEASNFARVDSDLSEGSTYDMYKQFAPKI